MWLRQRDSSNISYFGAMVTSSGCRCHSAVLIPMLPLILALSSIYAPAAQPGVPADRFARDRGHFEVVLYCALAATECQPVGPLFHNGTTFVVYNRLVCRRYEGQDMV